VSEGHPTGDLDDVVHQRNRLGILTILSEAGKADFSYLRDQLELTDGNLGRHLAVLADAGLVSLTKRLREGRARTWVSITPAGRRALERELDALRALLDRAARHPNERRSG
jgi:DNA-binding MarR family transcriptional regulator